MTPSPPPLNKTEPIVPMSEAHQPATMATLATHTPDPAAILPTTTAPEASTDPIRPTGTDALMAGSRPEVAAATENTEIAPGAGPADVAAKDEDGAVLGYKAPGLVK